MAEGVHFVVSTGLKYEPKRTLPDITAKCERVLIELRSGPDLPADTPPGQLLACIEVVTRTDIAQRTKHASWQTFEAFGTTQDDRWTTPVRPKTRHPTSDCFKAPPCPNCPGPFPTGYAPYQSDHLRQRG